jgi:hypothetical protein
MLIAVPQNSILVRACPAPAGKHPVVNKCLVWNAPLEIIGAPPVASFKITSAASGQPA